MKITDLVDQQSIAAGSSRIRTKMDAAIEFAAVYGQAEVDTALTVAAEAGRFANDDLASILRHRRQHDSDGVVVPLVEGHSLQPGTSRWNEVGR